MFRSQWVIAVALGGILNFVTPLSATAEGLTSVDELLQRVKRGWQRSAAENRSREKDFLANKNKQQRLLAEARAQKAVEEKRSARLEEAFRTNEKKLTVLDESLHQAMGNMGELFGVIRQVAGDTRSQLESSLISAQYPNRADKIASLVKEKNIPSAAALNDLWYVLQHEITESGKVVQFDAAVTDPSGSAIQKQVTRVGLFNAVAEGKYLTWVSEVGKLNELARQPSSRHLATVSDLEEAHEGMVRFAIDPSRGSILSLLVQTPSIGERLQFGGIIGYMILGLGALAFLGALIRIIYLSKVTFRVRAQKNTTKISLDNPLGRVMHVFAENPKADTETLSLKLDEAILREQSTFDKFLWAIKVVIAAAPLMGLLGTVTGMIRTFQAITLFGTGDPKLMAGGISEALVTTMLGLVVAIPLVLLHSWLRTMSRRLTDVLGEQSAGIVARQAESSNNG